VLTRAEAALSAPTAEAFAAELVRLLDDEAERRRLAANARELVRRRHSWEAFRENVHKLLDSFEARSAAGS
jgi:glycosyltransferase involved in cell wall biosynthesis